MNLSQDELFEALGLAMEKIEKAGASIALTDAVMIVGDIRASIGNKWNPAQPEAASRVRNIIEGKSGYSDSERLEYLLKQCALVNGSVRGNFYLPETREGVDIGIETTKKIKSEKMANKVECVVCEGEYRLKRALAEAQEEIKALKLAMAS